MVETAYKYAKVAQLALKERLGTQSEVNAALSIEILLKSVQAKSVNKGNDYISMRFSSKHGHNLLELYNTVPPTTKKRLGIESYKETFTEKKDVFITSRYDYEANAPSSSTDTLLQIAARLIPKLVDYFIEQGSEDPWLTFYKMNPQNFNLVEQNFYLWDGST